MRFLLGILLLMILTGAKAQNFTGTWDFKYRPYPTALPINMQLNIGKATEKMLYPANLKITNGDFIFSYELLLVQKNSTQLGIGRNKYPIIETPFKIKQWMPYLNGVLTLSKSKTGQAQLSLQRMWIDNFGLFMRGLDEGDEIYESSKVNMRNLLYREKITLTKTNSTPWTDPHIPRIVAPTGKNNIYYGIYDPITTKDSIVTLAIQDEELIDADTITLIQNGRVILNKHAIDEKKFSHALHLDTGMNTLALFADNYGRKPPNTGNLIIKTSENMYSFDFSNRSNAFATFLVAKFYRAYSKPTLSANQSIGNKPVVIQKKKIAPEKPIDRNTDVIANMQVENQRIELEIWDGQVEDGDSISLKLNDEWIHQKIAVKKTSKRFYLTLQPGKNTLLFRGDNLGSVPPNTAVLCIYYGDKTRTVYLDTDMKRDNILNIEFRSKNN